ncbi:OmpA family protein [Paracandidimonas soli]|uniref:OmpA family protein n=1 Tax=Paracandidimonas soli TaxID=1917182 RepID=UPI0033411C36
MSTTLKTLTLRSGGIALALMLAACGNLSQVNDQGMTDNPVFPDAEDATFLTGSFPNIDNLRQVGDGATRDQLYDLLGRPHFSEGFRVREWDYLFHFNTPEGRRTCQFKVLFDKDELARSFHWAPAECASILNQKPVPAPAPMKPFSLSGDVGFAFGSATLTTAGLNTVRDIASQLKQLSELQQVTVSGHTDRIGNDAANLRLSQQRAESVRNALATEGIPASKVRAHGFGEDRPLVQCGQQDRDVLIACLAPNRRVDIEVRGQQ